MPQFASTELLLQVISDQKQGIPRGVPSVCSANPYVLKETLQFGRDHQEWVLIESTSNQVNQEGGYTGMTPGNFAAYIADLADAIGCKTDQILLGGDHLGPNPWKNLPCQQAMEKAAILVKDCVQAGYRKIHLDTNMKCADDPSDQSLDVETEARRAAALCTVAEDTWQSHPGTDAPVYVIGTEVPAPGGVESEEEGLQVTKPESVLSSLAIFERVFTEFGLERAWSRVIAFVVQPGVEFSQFHVHEYDPSQATRLSRCIETVPGMIFEAHSTDYQTPEALRQLVKDHFAILKVGPALTFALREAVFSLARIEKALFTGREVGTLSAIQETLEAVMLEKPKNWQAYYPGDEHEQRLARKFSFSDRIRYYWPDQRVTNALTSLIGNLRATDFPLPLLSQFLPVQYQHIREGSIPPDPEAILYDAIRSVLAEYRIAAKP